MKRIASKTVDVPAVQMRTIRATIIGNAPYISNKFSTRTKREMEDAIINGSKANTRTKKEAKDLNELWKDAIHYSKEGWAGIPASGFRAAMISACKLVNYKMTLAKLSIMIVPDGFDRDDDMPLVKITKGTFTKNIAHCRNQQGAPIVVARGIMPAGWEANVTIKYDSDQFSEQSIMNLLNRVGEQVGIGGGRNDSKMTAGIGAGSFTIKKGKKAA